MNRSQKQVVLHIGTAKTGTTHLQRLMRRRREPLLREYGLLYPETWMDPKQGAHHPLAVQVFQGGLDLPEVLAEFDRLFADPAVQRIVLSSEAFANALTTEAAFERLVDLLMGLRTRANVKLVVVLREYSDFLESMYLHSVKTGDVRIGFDAYVAQRVSWFAVLARNLRTLRQFEAFFEVEVLTYDSESVVRKFERSLEVDLREEPNPSRTGKRLSLKSQAILYRWDSFPQLHAYGRACVAKLLTGAFVFTDDAEDYSLFTPAMRRLTAALAVEQARAAELSEYLAFEKALACAGERSCFDLDQVTIDANDLDRLVRALQEDQSNTADQSEWHPGTEPGAEIDPSASSKQTGSQDGRTKLVGLVPGKNEEDRIEFCIRAMAKFCDAIVYFDDNSTDRSVAIVERLAAECRVERIVRKTDDRFQESIRRVEALAAGREIGGTHFVILDADEAFSSNWLADGRLRKTILDLRPGDTLEVPFVDLWRSIHTYRNDGRMWAGKRKVVAFADDGRCDYDSTFIHMPRVPLDLKGTCVQIHDRSLVLMHFQFAGWDNMLLKQAWYRCVERLHDPSKSAARINALYAPTKDETNLELKPVPPEWFAGYEFLDSLGADRVAVWREQEVLTWFERHGTDYFADLDIWDIPWGERLGQARVAIPAAAELHAKCTAVVREAERLLEEGRPEEGSGILREVLTCHPEHALALNDWAVLQASEGDFDDATALLQRAHAIDPYMPEPVINLARLRAAEGNSVAASRLLDEYVHSHPNTPYARMRVEDVRAELEAPQSATAASSASDAGSNAALAAAVAPEQGVLPTLEVRKVSSYEEFEQHSKERRNDFLRIDQTEERLTVEQDQFRVPGYCYVCQEHTEFLVDFNHCGHRHGRPVPNWRERLVCPTCGLNNRLRASVHLFEQACGVKPGDAIYITEQVSPLYKTLAEQYPNLVGSEYLGDEVPLGSIDARGIRNESLTALSFEEDQFDHIMTFDVLEHVPDYRHALAECLRCLKPGGTLMFSVPFARSSPTNIVRAKVDARGEVEHILPPEYHGDPVNPGDGCLCFYHFGWELLDELRNLGFEDVTALHYWSADFGYLGGEQSVFFATKPVPQVQLNTAGSYR